MTVDSPGRNAAFAARWLLPFPIHSDPDGVGILEPLDLWNPNERGGHRMAHRHRLRRRQSGDSPVPFRDFADRRPNDDDLIAAVRDLGLSALEPPEPWVPDHEPVDDPGALRVEAFGPYFRGIRSAVRGLAGRLVDEHDRAEAIRMSDMADSFLDAWKVRREAR